MKRHFAALILGAALLTTSVHGVTLTLDGQPLNTHASVYDNTTFVSLRELTQTLLPDANVQWEAGRAVVRDDEFTLTARPGDNALTYNGARTALNLPVRLEEGRTLVPLRPLCALLGVDVAWSPLTGLVSLSTTTRSAQSAYTEDDLYWLSRIISAESQGEPYEGKIAVGNVVLNRVHSADFPDTIYGVIFDSRWGGQFEPVRNGSIYEPPTPESVQAAAACLSGANTVGDSLYFLAPALTDNHWTMESREYITTIGAHWFYR